MDGARDASADCLRSRPSGSWVFALLSRPVVGEHCALQIVGRSGLWRCPAEGIRRERATRHRSAGVGVEAKLPRLTHAPTPQEPKRKPLSEERKLERAVSQHNHRENVAHDIRSTLSRWYRGPGGMQDPHIALAQGHSLAVEVLKEGDCIFSGETTEGVLEL